MDSCSRRRRNRISRISERTLRLSEVRSMRSCLIATRCLVLLSSAEYTLDWPANLGCQAGTQINQLQGRKGTWTLLRKQSDLFRSKWASDPWRAALDIWIQKGGRQVAHIYRPVVLPTLPLKIILISRKNTKKKKGNDPYHVIYLRATLLEGWSGPFSLAHARRKINFWPEPF